MSGIDKKTILVVDDVELNRKILSVILEEQYNVIEAENGLCAKNELERQGQQVSLILLDLVMPVMDGFTFLKYMQSQKEYRDIPVILVTSETYEENILNGLSIGARDVIAKPYTPELVLRRVENLIALTENGETKKTGSAAGGGQAPQVPNAVLIVDDVGINRIIIRNALEEKYKILEAVNGQEALEILRQHKDEIAVVLLDIYMPVMDGYETMREAKRERLLDDIPVMAITSEDSIQILNRIMGTGICEVIQKPFTPSVIKNRVEYIVKLKQIGVGL